MYPVQAGREILQEAPLQMVRVLLEAIRAAQEAATVAPLARGMHRTDVTELERESREPSIGIPFCLRDQREGYLSKVAAEVVCGETCYECRDDDQDHRHRTASDRKSRGSDETAGRGGCSSLECVSPVPSREALKPTANEGRRARDFAARKERAATRKALKDRLNRQQEVARLKKIKQHAVDALEQEQEVLIMQREDQRSTIVDQLIA